MLEEPCLAVGGRERQKGEVGFLYDGQLSPVLQAFDALHGFDRTRMILYRRNH